MLDFLPFAYIPLLAAVTGSAVVLARRRFKQPGRSWVRSGLESGIVGAYGLLLSFGFLLSENVQRDHAGLVHDQAEALAMLYRESDLLPEPRGAAIRDNVRRILDLEVRMSADGEERRSAHAAAISAAFDDLWRLLSAASLESANPGQVRGAIDRGQRAISLEYRRRFNEQERAPGAFLLLLLISGLLVGWLVGWVSGAECHGWFVPVLYVALVGGTIATILDLNDLQHGLLKPSHENYAQLLDAIGH